jgi:hypothetical protein
MNKLRSSEFRVGVLVAPSSGEAQARSKASRVACRPMLPLDLRRLWYLDGRKMVLWSERSRVVHATLVGNECP